LEKGRTKNEEFERGKGNEGTITTSSAIPPYSLPARICCQSDGYALPKNILSFGKTDRVTKGKVYQRRWFPGESFSRENESQKKIR